MPTNTKSTEKTFSGLRKFNIFMGFLHLVQGVAILKLATSFALPVTTSFLQFNLMSHKLLPVTEQRFTLQIAPLIALFLFLSAAAHFIISLPKVYEWYVTNLKKGANYMRWVEYAFSSSIMMVVIAMLVGVYDGVSLMLIFALNACMILFGWMMELHNQSTQKTNWTAYIFGTLAGIVPWIAVAIYLFGAGGVTGHTPTFVYWIFFSIFVFFDIFALNQFLQYKKIGPWKNYIYGERVYIILSLVAKSLLAWQVFFGTLRPL